MLRLVVIAAFGYLGYRYFGNDRSVKRRAREAVVAGGPLSEQARLQSSPDEPPPVGAFAPVLA